jgi:hypothetical protein
LDPPGDDGNSWSCGPTLVDGAADPPGAADAPGRSDGRPDGATAVISPHTRIDAELPGDGASGRAADSLGAREPATAEADAAADPGATDGPLGARSAIECGDAVSSLIETGTVDVEVPLTTSSSSNWAAGDELGAMEPEGAVDADAPIDTDDDAAEADGPVVPNEAQSPSNSTAGIAAVRSPPTTPITTVD